MAAGSGAGGDGTSRRSTAGGARGTLPPSFIPWQRGVTCTVRPELLTPLQENREYRLNVTVRRSVPTGCAYAEYATLYRRATRLAQARLDAVGGRNRDVPIHRWVMAHAWFRQHLEGNDFVCASVTHGLVVAGRRLLPAGEPFPAAAALWTTGGHDEATFAGRHLDAAGRRHVDEIYSEFDLGDAPGSSADVTVSYGEYSTRGEIDFEPYVRRAEHVAGFYCESWTPSTPAPRLPIVMREWSSLATGKRAEPHLVTVHLFLRREQPEA